MSTIQLLSHAYSFAVTNVTRCRPIGTKHDWPVVACCPLVSYAARPWSVTDDEDDRRQRALLVSRAMCTVPVINVDNSELCSNGATLHMHTRPAAVNTSRRQLDVCNHCFSQVRDVERASQVGWLPMYSRRAMSLPTPCSLVAMHSQRPASSRDAFRIVRSPSWSVLIRRPSSTGVSALLPASSSVSTICPLSPNLQANVGRG